MKSNLCDYPFFLEAIQNNELVYLFGAGISSALTDNRSCSWWKWIHNGTYHMKDSTAAANLRKTMDDDSSTDNLIKIVGEVLKTTKSEGSYLEWMKESFESARVTNKALADTLKKLLITQDVLATTNYDLLLEQATDLNTITYEEPDLAFAMIDKRKSDSVLHLHGVFDSVHGIDNIVADQTQYDTVLNDKGAQFIQNILGTRTLIFVGCGQTTEDGNISQFIQFARQYLRMDIPYYFLYKRDSIPVDMPDNIILIPYGDEYSDLPLFLEDMAQARLKAWVSRYRIVGRSIFCNTSKLPDSLMQYHYSQESVPFCGRQAELDELLAFVKGDEKFAWWTVTGQAGAGKSRLAFETLHRLPACWFGFFLNDTTTKNDIERFEPFTNTLIIIDYVSGREFLVAEYIRRFYELFSPTSYNLRILLIERENRRQTGSWYSKLVQRFGKYDSIINDEYSNVFLNIEDLDDESVEQFIGCVCAVNGLTADPKRDNELKTAYGRKFEQLRFRPLYVQMFVEAWINNEFSYPRYDTYEDLLKYTLEREQEKWLRTLDGDQACCNAFIRLIVRANISGKIAIHDIPDIYKEDWNKVERFIQNHSFPGKQRQEEKISVVTAVCQNVGDESEEIVPMFPDIIKEYMFYYYSDEEALPEIMREIWQNAAADFTIFITRCLTDFPENDFYQYALNVYDHSTEDVEILTGRLEILKRWIIKDEDDPVVLYSLVCNEYEFWKSVVVPDDDSEQADMVAMLKVSGLNYVAKQFGGWSNYDLSDMMEAIDVSLDVSGGKATEFMKQFFLQEHITELSKAGFFDEAEYLRNKIEKLLIAEENSSWKSLIHMQNRNSEMMENILQGDFSKALEILLKMGEECEYSNIESVRVLAHSCFNIDNLAFMTDNTLYIGKGLELIRKAELLYPDDFAVKARTLGCRISVLQDQYFNQKLPDAELLKSIDEMEDLLDSIPFGSGETADEALNMTWGLLIGLKINGIKNNPAEMGKIIEKAENILSTHPHFDCIANAKVMAVHALHKQALHDKVSHAEVEESFKYIELNYNSNSLRETFFKMLEDSEDADHREDYKTKWVMYGARQGAKYDPIIGSGIPEVDLEADLMRELLDYKPQEPYKRTNRKIGANEPCPCGSGKKFKKCCRGNGKYD